LVYFYNRKERGKIKDKKGGCSDKKAIIVNRGGIKRIRNISEQGTGEWERLREGH
jgi:hypothetical protein